MSRRGSDQVVFPDASPCFAEEEWALLQQWQKNLYRNVMKEIHRALISLGPLIATTVCSLSATEQQDPCPMDRQNPSRRRFHTSPSSSVTKTGVLTKDRREEVVHLKNPNETARTAKNVCQRAGSPIVVDDHCVAEDPGVIIIDPMGAEEADSTKHQNPASETAFPVVTAVYSLIINDESTLFKEAPAGTFRAEPVVNSKHPEETVLSQQVVRNSTVKDMCRIDENQSQQQNPEPTHHSVQQGVADMGHTVENKSLQQKAEPSRRRVQQGAGVKCKRKPKKIADSLKGSEKTQSSKLLSRKNNTNEKHSSHMETNSTGQDLSLGGENSVQCGSKGNQLANFILSLGSPKIGMSDSTGDCESNPSSSLVSNVPMKCDNSDGITEECSGQSETRSRERKYACTECDKCFYSNSYLMEHRKTHGSEKTHKCTECSKWFFTKTQLARHFVLHLNAKKYQCTYCPRSFSQKHNIDGHLRTHTGEKPYKCSECDKEFTWRSGLVMHQRNHHAQKKVETTI